jgi:hypothetical protein
VTGAEGIAQEQGGFVLTSRLRADASPPRGEIICRVPRDRLAGTMNALCALGWTAERDVAGTDLTERYVGAERKLATDRAQEQRLRAAASGDRVRERARQDAAQADESRKAQDRTEGELLSVASATTLATVSATFLERPRPVYKPGLAGSWQRATAVAGTAVLRVLAALLWVVLFSWAWGPPLGLLVAARRWRRRL